MCFYSCFFYKLKKINEVFIHAMIFLLILMPHDLGAQDMFPYDLSGEHTKYELPIYLLEVSGISLIPDHFLAMVQDELGKLYIYDMKEKKIKDVYGFTDHGDFEGIEIVGKTAYILRSDGTIFELKDYGSENMKIATYSTFLTTKNDTEGLCYDSTTHSLLITCKSSPSNPLQSYKGNRAVYAFDLATHKIQRRPFLLVNRAKIEMRMNDDDQNFKPAGISIHPQSGDIYMVAASGQLMVITDRQGNIKWVKKLKKKIFKQPEGISFASDGTMYISSEGTDEESGYVLSFEYKPE